MDYHINTKIVHENLDAEKWIVEVTLKEESDNHKAQEKFTVYVDYEKIEVTPSGTLRGAFGWSNWIFDNLKGDVEAACAIAVLAVCGNEDTRYTLHEDLKE